MRVTLNGINFANCTMTMRKQALIFRNRYHKPIDGARI